MDHAQTPLQNPRAVQKGYYRQSRNGRINTNTCLLTLGHYSDPHFGVKNYYQELLSSKCSFRTFTQFINDRIGDGDLILVPSSKGTQRTLNLSEQIRIKFTDKVDASSVGLADRIDGNL
jgi:hypothetical protein